MKTISISKNLSQLTPDQFKEWFEKKFGGENWERHYKLIGGKIPKKEAKKKAEK